MDREIKLFPSSPLLLWYKKSSRKLPWREHISPYTTWISEIMLQQTRVENVIPYYERFINRFPNIQSLSRASESAVLRLWSGLGYYSRARNILKTAKIISQKHTGKFPKDLNALIQLPGIGNYTAGAILSIAYNLPFPILDGNVRRVLSRFYTNASDNKLWKIAEELVREIASSGLPPRDFNQALMELGALLCLPQNPLCDACPLGIRCLAKQKKAQAFFPPALKKQKTVSKLLAAAILKKEAMPVRILLRRREKHLRWLQGLWELPAVELAGKENLLRIEPKSQIKTLSKLFSKELNRKIQLKNYLGTFAHAITHHQLKVHVFEGQIRNLHFTNGKYRWFSVSHNKTIPSSSMLKKSLALWQAP